MAVYTEVGDRELDAFLAAFDVGRAESFKGIAEGVENSNYFLKTERGAYILTLYEKRVREEDLPYFLGLLTHLSAHGIKCPLPVRARDGRTYRELAGRPAALMTFLPGVSLRRPDAQQCGELGAALARLHQAGADYLFTRENALSVSGWATLAGQCAGKADQVQAGLTQLIAGELAHAQLHWPQGLPAGVIHADLFPDNVFFMDGHLSGLIDFYFACNDAFAYDIAVCLNAWCFESDGAYNITKGRSLLTAYHSVRRLQPAEILALPILARGAAFRFMLTRLYDWIHRDPHALVKVKDPLEYVSRLRFHRGATGAQSYGWPE